MPHSEILSSGQTISSILVDRSDTLPSEYGVLLAMSISSSSFVFFWIRPFSSCVRPLNLMGLLRIGLGVDGGVNSTSNNKYPRERGRDANLTNLFWMLVVF